MDTLREHILNLLDGKGAHVPFADAVSGVPSALRGSPVSSGPWTLWQLLKHIQITQWDILEFSRDPKHQSPEWPQGYWPKETAPADDASCDQTVHQIEQDLDAMKTLVSDPDADLFAPFPHGEGQTLLREALLLADHSSYHLGQFVLLRKLLGIWPA